MLVLGYNNFQKYLLLYLIILFIFSLYFLIHKSSVGNDSTISEWIINYSGGFTKRGLMGSLSIFISEVFEFPLRRSILILQVLIMLIYYLFLFNFLKNIEYNKIILLAVFSPILILYPLSEIEVLARKEIIIFSIFFILIFFEINFILRLFLITLSMLIWEPFIFFIMYWFFIDCIKYKINKIDKKFFLTLLGYSPIIIIAPIFIFFPLSEIQHSDMVNYLLINFNEPCGLSCGLLNSKKGILDQAKHILYLTPEMIIRYVLVIIIGFGPLIYLINKSNFKDNLIFFSFLKLRLKTIFLIMFFPTIICFLFMSDWGRVVNISYFFLLITYLFLYKNNFIELDVKVKNNFVNKINKKSFIFLFIIYCFTWAPKTAFSGDIASFPGYRVPYKIFKSLF